MANDLTVTAPRSLTTHSGAQALRRIERLASIADADAGQARALLPPNAADLVDQARDEARMWLTPSTKRDAKMHLSPTLALVAPVGMDEDQQTTWLATAMQTLSGIPADLLERGCQAARLKVDHPSKIVPAINAEIAGEWARRKAALAAAGAVAALLDGPAGAEPEYVTPEQAAAIRVEFGIANDERPSRPPPATAADYMAMGLSEMEAHRAVADHARMLLGKPIGKTEPAARAARAKAPPEIGYNLIAMALALRYVHRRSGDAASLAGVKQTLSGFLVSYGQPPFRALLPLARKKLRERAERDAA